MLFKTIDKLSIVNYGRVFVFHTPVQIRNLESEQLIGASKAYFLTSSPPPPPPLQGTLHKFSRMVTETTKDSSNIISMENKKRFVAFLLLLLP